MAADGTATLRAAPLLVFLIQECLDPILPDGFQVFDHAHVVFRAVPLIQRFEHFAGVFAAFITEAHLALCQLFAPVSQVGAVFTARQAARTVGLMETKLIQVLLFE